MYTYIYIYIHRQDIHGILMKVEWDGCCVLQDNCGNNLGITWELFGYHWVYYWDSSKIDLCLYHTVAIYDEGLTSNQGFLIQDGWFTNRRWWDITRLPGGYWIFIRNMVSSPSLD